MTIGKSYWAFTNKTYKWIILIIFPLIAIGIAVLGHLSDHPLIMTIPVIVCFVIFPMVDVMSDYWLLPGFYVKGNNSLEFLQTTVKFESVIKDVVIVDIVRRTLFYVGSYMFIYVMCITKNDGSRDFIEGYFYLPVLNVLISQIAVFISRFLSSANHVFACAMFSTIPNAIYIEMVKNLPDFVEIPIVISMAIFAVVVIGITIWFSLKKVRDSYYDE